MEYGVYLESSIVDLKPRVLDFLTKLVEKAKDMKDATIAFRKKEIAELTGKDTRTVSRYLSELEDRKIIQTKGRRGRAGGTVILFNTELIRFKTSDKALVNTDEPVSIDEIVEKKFPKKEKEPKKGSRNRRTKKQMAEAKVLQSKRQQELDELHSKLDKLGGVPDWDWFKLTNDPVGNYRTYLLSRLYNRYAALFTDRHNAEVEVLGEGNMVPTVSNDYDVLPKEFLDSSRWQQFEKLRLFCEDNDIDPAVYLSSQFNRSVFDSATKNNKKMLPFTNTMITDSAYAVYLQYCDYQSKHSTIYNSYHQVPAMFMEDLVVAAIRDAYDTAESNSGILQYSHIIKDFLRGEDFGEKGDALLDYYDWISLDMRDNVSFKTRDTLKKFVILQAMTLTGGANNLPLHTIIGAETTRIMLTSIKNPSLTNGETARLQATALGALAYPNLKYNEQVTEGMAILTQLRTLYETPLVLRLIMQQKNIYLSLNDLREAIKEYGKEKVPVDDLSVLDVDQITEVMNANREQQEEMINHEEITSKRTWTLEGAVETLNEFDDAFEDYFND